MSGPKPDNSPLELGPLEVGVRKEEEHLGELAFPEKIREELHGIGPDNRDILVVARVFLPQGQDPLVNIRGHLDADLHSKHQLLRENGGEVN